MRWWAAPCLALLAWPALADDARQWLSRMAEAGATVSYHGEIMHRHGDRTDTLEIARRAGPDGYVERLLTLSGPPREVVRDGKSVTCILPHGRASLAGERVPRNPFPADQWRYHDGLPQFYEFLDLGEDRVAGRQCKVIGLKPRDGFRYGYRLWIDQASGLLLKSDLVDARGRTIEQVAFTRIEIPAALDVARLEPTLTGATMSWRVEPVQAGVQRVHTWTVHAVPAGFTARGTRGDVRGSTQQVFSDGLARVSVFVAPRDATRRGLAGISRMGAVSAFGTVTDGRQVTVVGEVPPATVRMIGESLSFDRR